MKTDTRSTTKMRTGSSPARSPCSTRRPLLTTTYLLVDQHPDQCPRALHARPGRRRLACLRQRSLSPIVLFPLGRGDENPAVQFPWVGEHLPSYHLGSTTQKPEATTPRKNLEGRWFGLPIKQKWSNSHLTRAKPSRTRSNKLWTALTTSTSGFSKRRTRNRSNRALTGSAGPGAGRRTSWSERVLSSEPR